MGRYPKWGREINFWGRETLGLLQQSCYMAKMFEILDNKK